MSKEHLTWEELVDLCESKGDTPPAHIREGCPACEADLRAIRGLISALNENRPEKVPEELKLRTEERILQLIGKDQVEKLLAEIVFDSHAEPALASAERDLALDERRLVFRAGTTEILVSVRNESPGSGELTGQLILSEEINDDLRGIPVTLTGRGRTRSERTDDLGGFRFTGLGEGTYTLTVRISTTEIAVEGIEIQFS